MRLSYLDIQVQFLVKSGCDLFSSKGGPDTWIYKKADKAKTWKTVAA
jgi:hypothetical protein